MSRKQLVGCAECGHLFYAGSQDEIVTCPRCHKACHAEDGE